MGRLQLPWGNVNDIQIQAWLIEKQTENVPIWNLCEHAFSENKLHCLVYLEKHHNLRMSNHSLVQLNRAIARQKILSLACLHYACENGLTIPSSKPFLTFNEYCSYECFLYYVSKYKRQMMFPQGVEIFGDGSTALQTLVAYRMWATCDAFVFEFTGKSRSFASLYYALQHWPAASLKIWCTVTTAGPFYFRYGHCHGCTVGDLAVRSAARAGAYSYLKYLRKNGAQWPPLSMHWAANAGSLECLQYLRETGCAPDHGLMSTCILVGSIECFVYLHECGYVSNEPVCIFAAQTGSLECLKYALQISARRSDKICAGAARSGSIDCLRYAHENGCTWDQSTCSNAAMAMSIDCLRYAHERGCPWDANTCVNAAYSGSIACLRYAVQNGCPLVMEVLKVALKFGAFTCFVYAIENGCPCDHTIYECAVSIGHTKAVLFLKIKGLGPP